MTPDELKRLEKLEADFKALKDEFYSNNFTSSQDFPKYSRFNTRLKVPHVATLSATCEVGEICEQGGELNICATANTWVVVGTQS